HFPIYVVEERNGDRIIGSPRRAGQAGGVDLPLAQNRRWLCLPFNALGGVSVGHSKFLDVLLGALDPGDSLNGHVVLMSQCAAAPDREVRSEASAAHSLAYQVGGGRYACLPIDPEAGMWEETAGENGKRCPFLP